MLSESATPSWTSGATIGTLESVAPAEWSSPGGELFKWHNAPVGAQSITISVTESGGDLATPYIVTQKINIIFS
jgi:hypothetical protein